MLLRGRLYGQSKSVQARSSPLPKALPNPMKSSAADSLRLRRLLATISPVMNLLNTAQMAIATYDPETSRARKRGLMPNAKDFWAMAILSRAKKATGRCRASRFCATKMTVASCTRLKRSNMLWHRSIIKDGNIRSTVWSIRDATTVHGIFMSGESRSKGHA